jgi:hypothetical protein
MLRRKQTLPELRRSGWLIGLLLLAVAIAGCDTATPEEPTPTPISLPTDINQTPTPAGEAPTATPEMETPTSPTSAPDALLPPDQIWVRSGKQVIPLDTPDQAITLGQAAPDVALNTAEAAPAGTYILYQENTTQATLLDLSSGNTQTLGEAEAISIFRPRFAPDGQTLVYAAIGQQEWELQTRALPDATPEVLQTGANTDLFGPVAWTPTGIIGQQLRWQTDAPPAALLRLDPLGGTVETIRDQGHLFVSVSAAGQQFALVTGSFMLGPGLAEQELIHLDTTTGTTATLVAQTQTNFGPIRISPDGMKVFYARTTNPEPDAPFEILRVATANVAAEWALEEIGGSFQDAMWRNDETLLLLTRNADSLTVTNVGLGTPGEFTTEELGRVAVTDDTAPGRMQQILYVPGR